ncbi:MAG: hypothetical protein MK212_09940 [Saprospiraceae bacterium]|nr:hypothetical protein [Saprospiraceae bacterium]
MKTKLVLWGTKGSEEETTKVLIALELKPEDNRVYSWFFEGESATEEFSKQLVGPWRKGEAVAFPENYSQADDDLSPNKSLIPENITPEKEELLKRTQTEWLFIVLSTRLFKNYENELNDLQEKVYALDKYSKQLWADMKEFWAKVQTQSREQNLSKEHTNNLRDRTNELFAQLKKLRAVEDEAFEKEAKGNYDKIDVELKEVEAKLEQNDANWYQVFDKLKNLQRSFKDTRLTRALRSELWERIDNAFKAVKAKRSPGGSPSGGDRLSRRIDGLKGAINKMEESIKRDEKELSFQTKRINSRNANQLETQLREVRAKLIQERIDSKRSKLDDMYKTMKDLSAKLEKIEERERARKEKEAAEQKKKEEAEAARKKQEEEKAEAEANTEAVAEEQEPETTVVSEVVEEKAEETTEAVTEEQALETPVSEVVEEKVEETTEQPVEKITETEETSGTEQALEEDK